MIAGDSRLGGRISRVFPVCQGMGPCLGAETALPALSLRGQTAATPLGGYGGR